MVNLLDAVHEHLTPQLIAEAAKQLGEEEHSTSKALHGISATVLAGLLEQTVDSDGITRTYHQLMEFPTALMNHAGDLLIPGNLARHDPKDAAGNLLGQLFGARVPALVNGIAAFSGVKTSSVSFLLGVTGPLIMSLLGKRIQSGSLNVSGFINLLHADQDRIQAAVPPGLGQALGLHPPPPSSPTGPPPATGLQWVWPLALLMAFGGLIMLYLRQCSAS